MRVGITGASGLIGSALAAALTSRGDGVVRFVRPTTKTSGADTIRWDPTFGTLDDGDLARIRGLDALVNLSGAGIGDRRWTKNYKKEILRSRVSATSLAVKAMGELREGVGFFASASAVGYYGSRGDEVLDETSSKGTDFLSDVCQQWEDAAHDAPSSTPVAHLRTGIVVAGKGGVLKRQLPLFRLGLGGRYGKGSQWLSPISLRDEVAAILWILDHRLAGTFNLTAPEPLTNADFTKALAAQLHRPAFVSVPAPALKLALGSEMADELIFISQRVQPRALLESGFHFQDQDFSSALAWALGRSNP